MTSKLEKDQSLPSTTSAALFRIYNLVGINRDKARVDKTILKWVKGMNRIEGDKTEMHDIYSSQWVYQKEALKLQAKENRDHGTVG
ncbi:hypothetical protein H6P81_007391 [Aristolochia fimbriata]|uniref:Uncharacterized protein n=1 Tax=Aristolochia fimbriata TaxID=158543 RepID=A0AAV7F3W7_ARIFI|nr:hypothetical protein H6P81_007391 [Aristolochia fimbriata]